MLIRYQGNKFFRQGKNGEAASRYRQAALVYGPKPVYMNNLAAALLKLQQYVLSLYTSCGCAKVDAAATMQLSVLRTVR